MKGVAVKIDKEIMWGKVPWPDFYRIHNRIKENKNLIAKGVRFRNHALRINVEYEDPDFTALLEEKFVISSPLPASPILTFVRNDPVFGFKLPYKQYGYVSPDDNIVIVFASSFGVFKSVISGFASLQVSKYGYVPAHASIMESQGKGFMFIGGYSAGKTTTLINLVDHSFKASREVNVLTDDWAIIIRDGDHYFAETFDLSISFKESTLNENPDIRFHQHSSLIKKVRERSKISLSPEAVYGLPINTARAKIDIIVLLIPETGPSELCEIDSRIFASAVLDCAYHYPYTGDDQLRNHSDFWITAAQKLSVFSFKTRSTNGMFQNLDPLRRLLK